MNRDYLASRVKDRWGAEWQDSSGQMVAGMNRHDSYTAADNQKLVHEMYRKYGNRRRNYGGGGAIEEWSRRAPNRGSHWPRVIWRFGGRRRNPILVIVDHVGPPYSFPCSEDAHAVGCAQWYCSPYSLSVPGCSEGRVRPQSSPIHTGRALRLLRRDREMQNLQNSAWYIATQTRVGGPMDSTRHPPMRRWRMTSRRCRCSGST